MGANKYDDQNLKVGERCIIEVASSNNPPGLWWGRVTEVTEDSLRAVIDGGSFRVN